MHSDTIHNNLNVRKLRICEKSYNASQYDRIPSGTINIRSCETMTYAFSPY